MFGIDIYGNAGIMVCTEGICHAFQEKQDRRTSEKMKMISVQCPSCGANMDVEEERSYAFCSYCGEKVIIRADNEQVIRKIDEEAIKNAEVAQLIRLKELELEKEKQDREYAEEQKKKKWIRTGLLIWFSLFAIEVAAAFITKDSDLGMIGMLMGMVSFILVPVCLVGSQSNNKSK